MGSLFWSFLCPAPTSLPDSFDTFTTVLSFETESWSKKHPLPNKLFKIFQTFLSNLLTSMKGTEVDYTSALIHSTSPIYVLLSHTEVFPWVATFITTIET